MWQCSVAVKLTDGLVEQWQSTAKFTTKSPGNKPSSAVATQLVLSIGIHLCVKCCIVLGIREHRHSVTHVFCMCADVVGRFRIVGTLSQPLLYCVTIGRRVVVYAAFETASTRHVKCTQLQAMTHTYIIEVPTTHKNLGDK